MRIRVQGQNLVPEDGPGCGRPDEIEFVFSRDWDRFLKFAQFTQHGRTFNTMLAENRCHLPPEIREGPYYLNVTGITPDSRDRATSCYIMLRVPGTSPAPPPFPDVPPPGNLYAELQQQMEEAIRKAASLTLDRMLMEEGMAAESKATGEAIGKAREEALQAVSGEAGRLLEEIGEIRTTLQATGERLSAAETSSEEIRELLEKAAALEQAMAETEEALQGLGALEERMTRAEGTGNAHTERLESLESESGRQRGRLAALEGAGERTAGSVSALEVRCSGAERRLEALETAGTGMTARVENLEGTCAQTAGVLTGLQAKIPGMASELEDLSGRCDRRLDALEAADADRSAALRNLDDVTERLARGAEAAQDRVQGIQGKVTALEETGQTLTRAAEEARAERERLRESARRSGEKIRDLERKAGDGENRLREAERRLAAAEDTAGEHTAAIDVLNKTVLSHTVTLEALRDHPPERPHHGPGGDPEGWRRAMRRADDAMETAGRAARDLDDLVRRFTAWQSEQTRVQTRLEQDIRGAVMIQQGMQHAGRILGISEDGRVTPVDKRLASQVQADLAQTDSAEADFVKSKPFDIYDGYMAVSGLVLMAPDRTPYLLRVNGQGDLAVSAFTI